VCDAAGRSDSRPSRKPGDEAPRNGNGRAESFPASGGGSRAPYRASPFHPGAAGLGFTLLALVSWCVLACLSVLDMQS
jgi:hypothetical protein